MMCKNHMKLSFGKKLMKPAMVILQQSGVDIFEKFFLCVASHVKGSNSYAVSTCFQQLFKGGQQMRTCSKNHEGIDMPYELPAGSIWSYISSIDFVSSWHADKSRIL